MTQGSNDSYRVGMWAVGIDLSWTGRRPSGFATVQRGSSVLRTWTATMAAEQVAAWLERLEGVVVAAIDAPLVVGPEREAERALRRGFAGYRVSAFQVAGDFLERKGLRAGPDLGQLLSAAGWTIAPPTQPAAAGRFAFETFPRALALTMLGAQRHSDHKRGRADERFRSLAAYWALVRQTAALAGLELDVPPLRNHEADCIAGRILKETEDRLDAAVCALAAYDVSMRGTDERDRFGRPETGEIVVPGAARFTSARARTSPSG